MLGLQATAGNRATATFIQCARPVVARVPGATAVLHEHRGLTAGAAETTALVERLIGEMGWQKTSAWAYRFINADPATDLRYGGDAALVARCRDTLRAEITSRQQRVQWLTGHVTGDLNIAPARDGAFDSEADKETLDLLDQSEAKLRAELARYGLKVSGRVFKDYSMTGGPLQQGIRDNARDLAARRDTADGLGKSFTDAKRQYDRLRQPSGETPDTSGVLALTEAARRPWMDAEKAYREACNKAQATYSVLAAYTYGDDAADKLRELAARSPSDMAESLYKTIDERLENIKKVRAEIRESGGRYDPWKHPTIVNRTKPRLALAPWEARVVDERAIAARKGSGDDDAMMWAVIAIGLGLLSAIPTGGSGLVAGVAAGAAVLSTAYSLTTLYEHYKDYSLASAEHLSTFDQAEAISQEAPSLMWLAWDLLDLGMNVFGAAKAFQALRGAMAAAEKGGLKALPELIKATDQAGLGVAARSRVVGTVLANSGRTLQEMLQALRDGLAAAKPAPGKEALLEAIRVAAEKLSKRHIVRIGGSTTRGPVNGMVKALEESGKLRPGDDARNVAVRLIKDFNAGGRKTAGMYVEAYDLIMLRDNENLVGALTHEIAHRAQVIEKRFQALGTLRTEFQALHMEREILQMLPEDLVISADQKLLRMSSDEAIVNRIMDDSHYADLIAKEKIANPGMELLPDSKQDAAMIENWFLAGSAAR
ncbi:MAG TPA: hypothetical protein VGX25_20175 [Actinophytocola sp.]|uniref:hypothetical protein n=1 Tax=Actinophytocola sp. TaxID=1872138 RepID=UPI002DDD1C9C|nr:hypothetical protein [Actinophytocola sp.]HEV2781708.1 hypothetical protein [Actinophytocola sp.]